jgi:hypothetical protein
MGMRVGFHYFNDSVERRAMKVTMPAGEEDEPQAHDR